MLPEDEKTITVARRIKKNLDYIYACKSQNEDVTQPARTRRVLFVEGTDFKILSRFARLMGLDQVANRSEFTVVATEGFSQWPKLQALEWGFERTLGQKLVLGAVFDRDYRCDEEIASIQEQLRQNLNFAHIHRRKELENYVLIPAVLERTIRKKLHESARRRGIEPAKLEPVCDILEGITDTIRTEVEAQYIDHRVRFLERSYESSATITRNAISIFNNQMEQR